MKKNIALIAVFTAMLIISGCEKDNLDPDSPGEEPQVYEPAKKVEGRVAVAYVTYWGTAIPDARVLTHINYAFAELYVENGVYKGFKLQGKEERFRQIVSLKNQYPDLKILISFIHTVDNPDNSQGGGFSALSKSDEYRKAFAQDCLDFINRWGIDGVDIDWEFPGLSWSGHACDPAVDTDNYTLLMKQLRETLGSNHLLTYAGYVKDRQVTSSGGSRYIDVAAVAPYIDWVNIMTYNMDTAPHHHSALKDATAYWDCERAVNAYLSKGVPANKLVLGIPFYGSHSYSEKPTSLNYNTIIKLDRNIYKIDNWDNAASVPFVTKNGVYFCGYDNERSISIKGAWILGRGMKGLMYWSYDGDDAAGTLRKAVWEATMKR